MEVADVPEVSQLSTPEKIIFLDELWETIASDDPEVPVPLSHRDELDRRSERRTQSPGELLTLGDLQSRIETRKENHRDET